MNSGLELAERGVLWRALARKHSRVTWNDALRGHLDALQIGGGSPGILNELANRSALARPYDGYHCGIHAKAAALVPGIVSNHCFVDGYKRIALHLAEVPIKRGDYVLGARDKEFANVTPGDARSTTCHDDLVEWFRTHPGRP